jgi:DNA primase
MPRAVVLPAGEDPDSFLKAKGTEALETLASQAPTLIDFAVDRIFAEHGSGQENQARALAEACPLAARRISPIRRDLLAKMLAGRTRTSEDSVRQQIARAQRGSRAAPATPPSRTGRILPPSESTILAALLHYPQVRGQVPEESILTALPDGPIRTVAKRLLDAPAGPQAITADQLTHEDDDEQVHNLVARLMFAEPSFEAKQAARALQDAINDLESRKLEAEIKSVRAELDRARQEGPRERYDELFKRLIALQKQLEMIRI